jgi:hypothetical protein
MESITLIDHGLVALGPGITRIDRFRAGISNGAIRLRGGMWLQWSE